MVDLGGNIQGDLIGMAGVRFLQAQTNGLDHVKVDDILDARRIALMKPTACVINVSRGGLTDEEALYEAPLARRLGGAGLDVFAQEPPPLNHPVFALPNVCVTPHVGGSTDGTSRKRATFAAANLDRWAKGEPLEAQVG